jgi:predicted nucleotide-binding protein
MPKTTIFVGSSLEAKTQAKTLIKHFTSATVVFLPWWDCFTPGNLLLNDLENARRKIDAALILLTPDIAATVRGNQVALPNQNVLFELGYFFSALGASKIALMKYAATSIPKDLDGYTHIPGSNFFKPRASVLVGKKTNAAFNNWIASI